MYLVCIYIYIYTYVYIYIHMCVYIYIYIEREREEHPLEYATEHPLWTIPVNIHWTSDNPLEHTSEKWNSVGNTQLKVHWEMPLKSKVISEDRFLVCNICSLNCIVIGKPPFANPG